MNIGRYQRVIQVEPLDMTAGGPDVEHAEESARDRVSGRDERAVVPGGVDPLDGREGLEVLQFMRLLFERFPCGNGKRRAGGAAVLVEAYVAHC